MSAKSLVVFSDHCHVSLGEYFRSLGQFENVDSYQPEFFDDAYTSKVLETVDQYDIIVSSITDEKSSPFSTSSLKSAYGDRVVSFAPVAFYGLHPDVSYVIHKGDFLFNEDLTGDYHYSLLLELIKRGLSLDEAVHLLMSSDASSIIDVEATWKVCLASYESSEAGMDVKMADFVGSESLKDQTFYCFNLPSESVLAELGDRILKSAGLDVPARTIPPIANDLTNRAYFPVSDFVAETLGLEYKTSQVLRNHSRAEPLAMSRETALRQSGKFFFKYCRSKKCSLMDLSPFTPVTLKDTVF